MYFHMSSIHKASFSNNVFAFSFWLILVLVFNFLIQNVIFVNKNLILKNSLDFYV